MRFNQTPLSWQKRKKSEVSAGWHDNCHDVHIEGWCWPGAARNLKKEKEYVFVLKIIKHLFHNKGGNLRQLRNRKFLPGGIITTYASRVGAGRALRAVQCDVRRHTTISAMPLQTCLGSAWGSIFDHGSGYTHISGAWSRNYVYLQKTNQRS